MARREFQFIDGTSKKFWTIELQGSSHAVHFGRIGTAGQKKTKDFADEAAARKAHDKLVAEKLKEGYQETTGGPAVAAGGVAGGPAAATAKTPAAAIHRVAAAPGAATAKAPAVAPALDLAPEDWFWATWRDPEPLQRPAAASFDLETWLAKAGKIRTTSYGWVLDPDPNLIGPSLARPEAQLWFLLLTEPRTPDVHPKEIARHLANSEANQTGEISLDEVRKQLERRGRYPAREVMIPLGNLFAATELVDLITGPLEVKHNERFGSDVTNQVRSDLAAGFGTYLVPYLTRQERTSLRDRLRPALDPSQVPSDFYKTLPPAFYLAARLGLGRELAAATAAWADDSFGKEGWKDHYCKAQLVVFGLESAAAVEKEFRRLGLVLKTPTHLRAWLACTELGALDFVRDSVLARGKKEEAAELVDAFAELVHAPQAAETMLELSLTSKAPAQARRWLEANLGCAVAGLIPTAAGKGKLAEAAAQFLRDMKKRGHGPLIEQCLTEAPPAAAASVRKDVIDVEEVSYEPFDDGAAPDWLKEALGDAGRKKLKPPAWVQPSDLPPLTVGKHRLNDAQVAAVFDDLRGADLRKPPVLLKALKEHADRGSLDAFAWRLFERWMQDGAPNKEKWAMAAIGLLGGDLSVLKITPRIREWPGESQHQRAVFGLECLRAVGSDTALMQLNGIAQKLKFKGLKARAMECMEAVAVQRGMTRAELEDCIVPDCDLDERGNRTFDFGPRQFTFVLGQDLKPMVRDDGGKPKSDLPKPGAKDDAAKAGAAVEDWKLLKKTLREVLKVQTARLEQAMVTGRRWPLEKFQSLLVRHPLMTHLVRRLLWGVYDDKDDLIAAFRVTEERDFADAKDGRFDPGTAERIGIVHPAHVSTDAAGGWGEVFGDYEIIPPFPQLGRPIYGLEPGEETQTQITRFSGPKIPAITLVGILDRQGWARGVPQDGGVFYEHSKPFYGANLTAVVEYDGVPIGFMDGWEDQHVKSCYFVPGIYTPKSYPDHKNAVELGKVHPVVVSEVLRDLAALAAKGT
jgi:predicted DNA-binding WGR domain protein